MNDLEITRLCAQAMGYELPGNEWAVNAPDYYHPLGDDAQAMALIKQQKLAFYWRYRVVTEPRWEVSDMKGDHLSFSKDLNRAICLCVANMQKAIRDAGAGEK